jgi:hypothetical protein
MAMRRKVIFYPMYEETLVIESVQFDGWENQTSYSHHYTLKTPAAGSWKINDLLRELADTIDTEDNWVSEVP